MPFMSRVTSLTSMPEAQLNRWIKRIGLLLIIGVVAFVAFYAVDRFRLPQTPIVDRQLTALAIKRTDADAMNLLGAAYVKAGTPDKAVEPLRKAIEFVPIGWAEPYQTLADAYTASGDTDLAAWAGAMAAANIGDIAGAITRLTAISNGPAGLDARIGLGLLAEMSSDAATAEQWYRKALELDPKSTSATLGLSRVTGSAGGHPSIAPSPSAGSN